MLSVLASSDFTLLLLSHFSVGKLLISACLDQKKITIVIQDLLLVMECVYKPKLEQTSAASG